MKKTYNRPQIKIRQIETEQILAASGITTNNIMNFGESQDNVQGDAKRGIQFGNFGSAKSTIDWDDEE